LKKHIKISQPRKEQLRNIATIIREHQIKYDYTNVMFVCTHNSRRSHLAQLLFLFAASHYRLENISVFSSGTEATRIHQNAMASLSRMGYTYEIIKDDAQNPHFLFNHKDDINKHEIFSKTYDDPSIPREKLIAIMVCDDAYENCPYIPGADARVSLSYIDPKRADGTNECEQVYDATRDQILEEMMFLAGLIVDGDC
jgi:arsenate reductase (thioredoxin)